ncbi:hypothetical protein [Pseudobacillus badius]|nr:hypothetical protein [Bacillus badius]
MTETSAFTNFTGQQKSRRSSFRLGTRSAGLLAWLKEETWRMEPIVA